MTYNEITEVVNEKLRENTRILKNGEIHCCKRNDEIGKKFTQLFLFLKATNQSSTLYSEKNVLVMK